MAREYAPIFLDWPTVTRELNAQEKGRLIDAIVAYQAGKNWQEQIKGNERYVFPGYQVRIDKWNAVSDKRAKATKGEQTETNEYKQEQTETNADKNAKVKSKKDKILKEKEETREDMPFGLTDEDIQASLDRRQQLEDAARSIGLQVTEAGMLYGERLVREHGLEKVLDAIKKAVDVPKWAYVEGICKGKGVKPNDNHGDHGTDSAGTRRGKYSFLFDGTEAV